MDFNIKRLASCFVDHAAFSVISAFIMLPGMILDLLRAPFGPGFYYGSLYLNSIALAIYLSKDVIMSKSIGKRLFKLSLVSTGPTQDISSVRLLARNLTFFIWPIEIAVLFLSPDRRIGDRISKVRVVEDNNDHIKLNKPSSISRIAAFILALVISYLIQLQVFKLIEMLNEAIRN